MSARVLKWDVPVDDHYHQIGTGRVLHIACQSDPGTVQVWTLEDEHPAKVRVVRVYATGQALPRGWQHLGTALALMAGPLGVTAPLVWHVFEAPPDQWLKADDSSTTSTTTTERG